MYCSSCGARNDDEAKFCKDCGKGLRRADPEASDRFRPGSAGPPPHIPNYLVQAILVTIFCCQPFGIVSIVYAAQVNVKVEAEDIGGARQASQNAKVWAWVSFGVGLVLYGGSIGAFVLWPAFS